MLFESCIFLSGQEWYNLRVALNQKHAGFCDFSIQISRKFDQIKDKIEKK